VSNLIFGVLLDSDRDHLLSNYWFLVLSQQICKKRII